jgi:ABC-type transport system involved in cytochrome bd biosynthesis fused ATPase/permease subunit
MVTDSALVVADDLSASLDADTEALLLDRLLDRAGCTLVVVSHRPAVLARADVVLDLAATSVAR